MLGSFIGTFAVGLLSAHVYCNGSAIKKKLENAYDSFLDIFRDDDGCSNGKGKDKDCTKRKPPKKQDDDDPAPVVKDKVKTKKSKAKPKANARKRDARGHFVKTK